ncbi:MAG: hypothetical protein SCH66_11120 [Methanolobus sp.]|nr:hypothetical protein [Methanolobus sp.]
MNNDNTIPSKYWLYVWGILVVFFALSYAAFMPEGFSMAILTSILVAGAFTLWLVVLHLMWFEGSLLLKILALIFGGLFAVVFVILIQFVYEGIASNDAG